MTREKLNERAMNIEARRQEAREIIAGLTDEQIKVLLEALKIHKSDETKTAEECLDIAAEKLGYWED